MSETFSQTIKIAFYQEAERIARQELEAEGTAPNEITNTLLLETVHLVITDQIEDDFNYDA
jgi:hypothetical protein